MKTKAKSLSQSINIFTVIFIRLAVGYPFKNLQLVKFTILVQLKKCLKIYFKYL